MKLTTAQFAKIHNVNKRTLHYYDSIGLFSPAQRGKNGYRYYDISQSMDFEYILMLKELDMSIEEINDYCKNPSSDKFLKMADEKERQLELQIEKLKRSKRILDIKKEQIKFCENLNNDEIRIENLAEENFSVLPYDFSEDDLSKVFMYVKDKWHIEQIRMGIGSFISLDKVIEGNFEKYDGIYTYALEDDNTSQNIFKRTGGKYLCGYKKGTWDKAPEIYKKMIEYAEDNNIALTGYAYEIGLNEFAISCPDEYVTKFMIKITE